MCLYQHFNCSVNLLIQFNPILTFNLIFAEINLRFQSSEMDENESHSLPHPLVVSPSDLPEEVEQVFSSR